MVDNSPPTLNLVFGALAHPARRAIMARLRGGSATVGEVAEPFAMSLTAVSKHVRVLEDAGLIARRVQGREHRLQLHAEPLRQAVEWMATYRDFWTDRLAALEELLVQSATEEPA